MAKVCFVTYDILGPIKNGGIGTAMTAAAQALLAQGHEVTILYPSSHVEDKSLSYWTLDYKGRGISFQTLFSDEGPVENSYLIYQWLKPRNFDVVHFHDWRGPGFWSCIAKHQGLAFENTTLICQIHGQTFWHLTNSAEFLSSTSQLEMDFIERKSVELADLLFSPSQYMLDWMMGRGWVLPPDSFVSPNLLPSGFDTMPAADEDSSGELVDVDELVFFGRLESRKGVDLFCNAISLLARQGVHPRQVTFLGKEDFCGGEPSTALILRSSATWKASFSIINNLDVFGAKSYLKRPGRLAVIASVIENSPYAVLESLASSVPFVASDVGGVAELIHPADHKDVLFSGGVQALASRLHSCLTVGARIARPSIGFETARRRWLEWHDRVLAKAAPQATSGSPSKPRVSVCMSHFSRPHLLRLAIESIRAQTYPHIEFILVDDASPDSETDAYLSELEPEFQARGWKIIRNGEEMWTGAARNLAVSNASGDYVMLMDDDNVARSNEVSTFVSVAQKTGADILTCQMQPFVGSGPPPAGLAELPIGWMPQGPNLPLALYQNCLGDANMLIKRSVWNALGGFTTDRYGCEDWEFLVKCVAEGYKLEVVPEILFHYRHSETSLGHRYNSHDLYRSNLRQLRPISAKIDPSIDMALQLAVQTRLHAQQANRQGYWQQQEGSDQVGAALGRLPLNTGEALVEIADVALRRGQFESSLLLYAQALRVMPTTRMPGLEGLTVWPAEAPTSCLAEFLQGAELYGQPGGRRLFLKLTGFLRERVGASGVKALFEAAATRHPNYQEILRVVGDDAMAQDPTETLEVSS